MDPGLCTFADLSTDENSDPDAPQPCDWRNLKSWRLRGPATDGNSKSRCFSGPTTDKAQTLTPPRPCDQRKLGSLCPDGIATSGNSDTGHCRGPTTDGRSNPVAAQALRPAEAQTRIPPRPCDRRKLKPRRHRGPATDGSSEPNATIALRLRKLKPRRNRRLATTDAQTLTLHRPFDRRSSEPRRHLDFSTERPQTLTTYSALRQSGTQRPSRNCLLDKNGSGIESWQPCGHQTIRPCITLTLRPKQTRTLHLDNFAAIKNSRTATWGPCDHQESLILRTAANDYLCSGICATTALRPSIALKSASLQPFGCLELQILRLSSLSTAETSRICVRSSLSATHDSGKSASQRPCNHRELWNSHLSNLAATENSGTRAWRSCNRQELRDLRPGSLSATWNSGIWLKAASRPPRTRKSARWHPCGFHCSGFAARWPCNHQELRNLHPGSLATARNSEQPNSDYLAVPLPAQKAESESARQTGLRQSTHSPRDPVEETLDCPTEHPLRDSVPRPSDH